MNYLESSSHTLNWDKVREEFLGLEFFSITNDKSWSKFINTFRKLQDYEAGNFDKID